MKRLFLLAVLLLATSGALFAQGSAYTNVAALQTGGNIMRVIPSAPVVVCSYPGTGGTPCTNLATTYTSTSLSVACSSITQVVAPSTGTCSGTADFAGNFGFFAPVGTYVYYFEASTGWQGPYTVVLAPGLALAGNGTFLPTTSLSSGGATGDCVNWQAGGALGDTGSPCGGGGGGGSPASPTNSLQINNVGSFGAARTNLATAGNFNGIRYVSNDYVWSQSPAGSVSIGANTISLTPCPPGIMVSYGFTSTPWTEVLVSGAPGAAETPVVTAATCTQAGGANGTITFTAANTHNAGFTVGTASVGWQEAINASMQTVVDSTIVQKAHVVAAPGDYGWSGKVTAMASGATLDFSGTVIQCNMQDDCLYIGDPNGQNRVSNVTVNKFSPRPGVAGNFAALRTNAQHTHIIDMAAQRTLLANYFGAMITADDDESFLIDHLNANNGSGNFYHCGTDFCSTVVRTGLGSAVGWITNSNFSPNCGANGVDWESGNTLHMSNNVIQGFAQYGVRAHSSFGNNPSVQMDHSYYEIGGCVNPLGLGQTGLAADHNVTITGSIGPIGKAPLFANTGGTQYNYYVVAVSSTVGRSAPLLAGTANSNGAGNITVKWLQIGSTGTITYELIRTSGLANNPAPFGNLPGGTPTASGSVALALTVAGNCAAVGSTNICSFVDNAAANTTAYAVTSSAPYYPNVWNASDAGTWPGAVVYGAAAEGTGIGATGGVNVDFCCDGMSNSQTNPISQLVSSIGPEYPAFTSDHCTNVSGGVMVVCLDAHQGPLNGATVLRSGTYNGTDPINSKGRLIFQQGRNSITTLDLQTLVDSNWQKTTNTTGQRPTNDAADTAICLDNAAGAANTAGLCLRAPVSISQYINSVGDGSAFLERLTSALKTFKVPVTTTSQVTSTLATGTAPLVIASTTPVANLTLSNHPLLQDCGATTTCANTQKTTPLMVIGRVSFPTATTVTVTQLPFTSSTSYTCTAQDVTTAAGVVNATTYTSGSSVTFTETGGVNTDAMRYQCSGF